MAQRVPVCNKQCRAPPTGAAPSLLLSASAARPQGRAHLALPPLTTAYPYVITTRPTTIPALSCFTASKPRYKRDTNRHSRTGSRLLQSAPIYEQGRGHASRQEKSGAHVPAERGGRTPQDAATARAVRDGRLCRPRAARTRQRPRPGPTALRLQPTVASFPRKPLFAPAPRPALHPPLASAVLALHLAAALHFSYLLIPAP